MFVSGACLNGRTPQTLSSDNTFCPQYSQSSCCDPSYVEYSCNVFQYVLKLSKNVAFAPFFSQKFWSILEESVRRITKFQLFNDNASRQKFFVLVSKGSL